MELQKFSNTTLDLVDINIKFALENGVWLNATDVAGKYNKDLSNYWRSPDTKKYIESVCMLSTLKRDNLKSVNLGKGKKQGTSIHSCLQVHFLLWCGVGFTSINVSSEMMSLHFQAGGSVAKVKSKPKKSEGIYIITDGEFCKIGVATSIKSRLKQLQVGNGRKLEVVEFSLVSKAITLESLLHSIFSSRPGVGEWFLLDRSDIKRAVKIIKEAK